MSRLGNTAFDAGRGRPVGGEELSQRTGLGIDESGEAQLRDVVRHLPPDWVVVDCAPGERALQEMHVRIGALGQAAVAIFEVSAVRMRQRLQRGAQLARCGPASGPLAEHAMSGCQRQQAEGLVVEIERRVVDTAVETDHRGDGAVGLDEPAAQIIERVRGGLAPWPVPAEPAGFAINENLPRDRPRPVRRGRGAAVEIDGFMKAAA